MIVKFMSAVEL